MAIASKHYLANAPEIDEVSRPGFEELTMNSLIHQETS